MVVRVTSDAERVLARPVLSPVLSWNLASALTGVSRRDSFSSLKG